MKVAFFSDRPFGLMGTPGTYLFVEKILKYLDALIFAPIGEKDIVFSANNVPIYPVKNLTGKTTLKEIISSLRHFDPDIIYVINFAAWYHLVEVLKEAFPTKKYILDIKTPLLIENRRRQRIQDEGTRKQHYLDEIVSLSEASVKTWFQNCHHEPVIYPLGIDLSLFHRADSIRERQRHHRFVYIGILHPKRQINVLLDFFKDFTRSSSRSVSLDIYGSGPEEGHLRKMIASHSLGACVRLAGLWPQKDLLERLPDYDAGIAWVPYEHYDNSPSLKALEYMASGLPILASDTKAHNALAEQGLTIDFFSNNLHSFHAAMKQVVESGFSAERVKQNCETIKSFDYDAIIQRHFLPLFDGLVGSTSYAPATVLLPLEPPSYGQDTEIINKFERISRSGKKKDTLKLLFLCHSMASGKGGMERVATAVANTMSARSHLIYIAYSNTGRPAYRTTERVILLPFASLAMLKEKIQAIDPDVFLVFYIDPILIRCYTLIHDTSIPFCMQECTNPVHLYNIWRQQGKALEVANWEREMIGSAAARIRLTMPDYMFSLPGYIQPSVRAFPNPAFPQEKVADPAGDSAFRKVIINVGGMRKKNKNLITLLRAFARLAPMFPDWDIKVVGEFAQGEQPHTREILDFIQAHSLSHRVQIYGPVENEDIFSEYAASQIHAISSLNEGCPICVLEAMATGLPSIGFADCPGTNQLIRHEKNGLLASPEDRVSSMENALRQLMSSADIRERMGRQALEDSKAFDPRQVYDQWETLFYEAAEYKKDPGRLLREQMAIDPERAMHAYRCRKKLVERL